MKLMRIVSLVAAGLVSFLIAVSGWAAEYPAPKEGDWVVRDFRFHSGEVLPELRLHYVTVGASTGEPVLILHGTGGSTPFAMTPSGTAATTPKQPRSLQAALVYFSVATSGGNRALYKAGRLEKKPISC